MASLQLASSYSEQRQVDVWSIGVISAAAQAVQWVPLPALEQGATALGKDRLHGKDEGGGNLQAIQDAYQVNENTGSDLLSQLLITFTMVQ